jgi:hypothetical protein
MAQNEKMTHQLDNLLHTNMIISLVALLLAESSNKIYSIRSLLFGVFITSSTTQNVYATFTQASNFQQTSIFLLASLF